MKLLLTMLLPLGLTLYALPTFASVHYVSTTGNNNNDGSISRPYRTIAKGLQMLQPGGTLYIRGGIYEESQLRRAQWSGKSGRSAGFRTRIMGYPGDTRPVFKCTSVSSTVEYARAIDWPVAMSNLWISDIEVNYTLYPTNQKVATLWRAYHMYNVTVSNMTFNGPTRGMGLAWYGVEGYHNSTNVVIKDCLFTNIANFSIPFSDAPLHPLYWNGVNDSQVIGNTFDGVSGSWRSFALHLYADSSKTFASMTNMTVSRNRIYGSQHQDASFSVVTLTRVYDSRVDNNLIVARSTASNHGVLSVDSSGRVLVANNTLYGGTSFGIRDAWGSGNKFVNNLCWSPSTGAELQINPGSQKTYWTNNMARALSGTWTNSTAHNHWIGEGYDPGFVDAPLDLSLSESSSATNGVQLLGSFGTDLFGRARPSDAAWSLGAIQQQWMPAPSRPARPVGFEKRTY